MNKNTTQPPLEPAIQRFREKFTCKFTTVFGKEVDVLGYWDEDNQLRQYKPEQIEAFISGELKAEREKGIKEALDLCAVRLADEMPDCIDCSGYEDSVRIVEEITMEDFEILPVARHGER